MADKPRVRRTTKAHLGFSDATSHDVPKVNRTRRRAMIIGYGRTSSVDQAAGLDGQIRDLKAAGAERVYSEQCSSRGQRPKLAEAMGFLRDGDTLVVTKPDRLARSTQDLLAIVTDLTARGIGLVILSMGGERLDTRNPTSKLMLTILAGVATWEREIMLERQREGIAAAKAAGRYAGRPVSLPINDIRRMRAAGVGPATIAKTLKIARSSVYRALALWQVAAASSQNARGQRPSDNGYKATDKRPHSIVPCGPH